MYPSFFIEIENVTVIAEIRYCPISKKRLRRHLRGNLGRMRKFWEFGSTFLFKKMPTAFWGGDYNGHYWVEMFSLMLNKRYRKMKIWVLCRLCWHCSFILDKNMSSRVNLNRNCKQSFIKDRCMRKFRESDQAGVFVLISAE